MGAAELAEKTIALLEAWATKMNEIVLLDPSRSVYQVPGRTGSIKSIVCLTSDTCTCMSKNRFCIYMLATRVVAIVHHGISPF